MAAAAAQRNMMQQRYPGPPLKRSPSMMGYNQPNMMAGSPMTPDQPGSQFGPFGPGGPGGMNKSGYPPQYQPPGYNGPGMGGMSGMGGMGGMSNMNPMNNMGGSVPGMGMPPQYNPMNNMNNTMNNMSMMGGGQQLPPHSGIQPVLSQRRPSTLQYQPNPPGMSAPSPGNNKFMPDVQPPPDVKPQIAGPPQQMKTVLAATGGTPATPIDIKPQISKFKFYSIFRGEACQENKV